MTTETDARSVRSSVEVPVPPDVAFYVFTAEVDLWWVRGPINHHAGGRMRAMRIEPGVGGRVLEVYDDETGDALELARITRWQPPGRLSWRSSIDDVEVDVVFVPSASGTTVEVRAAVPAGGADRGGTSWVRVVPQWLGDWCLRRDHAPHVVADLSRLALGVSYARPAAASRFLAEAFGFEPAGPLPEDPDPLPEGPHGPPWIEFRLGNASLMVFDERDDRPAACAHEPWVYVDDLPAHFERAKAAGSVIVEPVSSPWGLPFYVAEDPEGRRWRFVQARPTMR
jgi:uncharacterized glyoxalase superfamily protein PhnB